MGENTKGGSGESGSVDEAGVGELVENDGVAFSDEGGDGAERGGVAVGESEGGFGFFCGGESCL